MKMDDNILHATSKQTTSWEAVRETITNGPVETNTLIGGTPLIDFTNLLSLNKKVTILAKAEYMNPSGSIKDRIAGFILQAATDSGELKEGMTVVAATSGNTGSAIAMACAIRGYDYIVITNKKCSIEKIDSMKAYGGTVIVAKSGVAADDPEHYQNIEKTMVNENPDKYFGVNQYDNQNNSLAYFNTLGPEIYTQTKGDITHFIAGASTGGTLTGTARYLKSKNNEIKCLITDPKGSVLWDNYVLDVPKKELKVGKYEVEGVGKDSIPGVLSWDVVDGAQRGDDASSFYTCRTVASKLGILVGGSSGLNLHAASVLSGKIEEGVIVTVLPDSGIKYLSKIFNDEWMKSKGLLGAETSPSNGTIFWKESQTLNVSATSTSASSSTSKFKLSSKEQTEAELHFLEEIATQMVDYHRNSIQIGKHPVVCNKSPETLRRLFAEAGVPIPLHDKTNQQLPQNELLQKAIDQVLQYSVRSSSPLFLNQLFSGVDIIGLAGEWISSTLNANVHTFEVAPVFTEIEKACLDKIVRCWLKTPPSQPTPAHDGLFVPGGSISILYSILLARDRADPSIRKKGVSNTNKQLVMFCSDNAHYSYRKGAIVTGIGEDNIILVKSLKNGKIDPMALKQAISDAIQEGKTPFYVGTTAGTTVLGAYDDFTQVFSIINEFNCQIWKHVDGAWGGGAMLSQTHQNCMNGTEFADSYNWNPHKMLGTPLQCSAFVCRHPGSLTKANCTRAEYLFQPDKNNAGADLGDRTIQCGRKSDAFKLWLTWKVRGDKGLAAIIDRSFYLAKFVQDLVLQSNGTFRLVHPAQCANVGFWYIPPRLRPFQHNWEELRSVAPKIKNAMQAAGDAMIGFQPISSMGLVNFFRLVLPNPRHLTEADLIDMLHRIDQYGQDF